MNQTYPVQGATHHTVYNPIPCPPNGGDIRSAMMDRPPTRSISQTIQELHATLSRIHRVSNDAITSIDHGQGPKGDEKNGIEPMMGLSQLADTSLEQAMAIEKSLAELCGKIGI